MISTIILSVLSLAGAVCGVWGLGEKEGICKYGYINEEDEK